MDAAGRAVADLRAATSVWRVLVAVALAADVALIRAGQRDPDRPVGLLTDVARTPGGIAARLLLELHFLGWLGRADPFRLLGSVATWWPQLRRVRLVRVRVGPVTVTLRRSATVVPFRRPP